MVRLQHVSLGISEIESLSMFHLFVFQHNERREMEHVGRDILNHEYAVDHRLIVEYKLQLSMPIEEHFLR